MSFYKNIFLLVAAIYSTNSFSCTSSGTAGKYCHNLQNSDCPAGCYCPGKGGYTAYSAGKVENWCKNRTGLNSGGLNSDGTVLASCVYLCPSSFPSSDSGAKSADDCYASCGGTKLPYKKIHCDKGYFLHYKTKECYKCEGRNNDPSLSANEICVGGDFYPTCGMNNQGTKKCEEPLVPNEKRTECVLKTVTCNSDEIYNADKTACTKCGGGTHPNSSQTECVEASAQTVEPGYYLPKGYGSKPTQCKQSTYYCPGGDFTESDTADQGQLKCPTGTTANAKKTACKAKIKKDQLKKGPNSSTPEDFQCWKDVGDAEKYKTCVISNPYYK